MAISIGRNQNQIFGKIDGVKFPNLPLNKELFESLSQLAKDVNASEAKGYKDAYKQGVEAFKSLLEIPNIQVKEEVKVTTAPKQQVKVGNSNFTVKLDVDARYGNKNKPYLVTTSGTWSRFYIPDALYKRIQDGESKGLDTTPLFKFFIRALRGEKMTQDKLNRLDSYISKEWLDSDKYKELLEKGYSDSKAKSEATFLQVPITLEGFMHTYKASTITLEPNKEAYRKATEDKKEDLSGFRFKHPRNKSGHFLAKGSEGYISAWNQQVEEYKKATGQIADLPTIYAEDYVFQPANMGQGGDAFYCGDILGHSIKVGFVHKLPHWSQVDTTDGTTVRPGLHVGGISYIQSYTNINSPVHNIFVDPQFVGAVATDNSDGALRVKEYYVHSSFIAPNKGTYNSSTYGKIVDEEWDKMIQEAQEIVAKAAKAQELLDSTFVI